jgi:hypothetical protein
VLSCWVSEAEATGRVAELYKGQQAQNGFVMEAMQSGPHGRTCCQSTKSSPTRIEAGSH